LRGVEGRNHKRMLPVTVLLVSASLLVLSYPPVGQGWLAYVALLPYLQWLAHAPSLVVVLQSSAVLGAISSGGLLYFTWMIIEANWLERAGAFLAVFALFALQLSLFSTVAWLLLRQPVTWRVRKTYGRLAEDLSSVVAVACWWWASEWMTQSLGLGLSMHLGLTQWAYPPVVRLARWVGLSGVSALVVGINGALMLLIRRSTSGGSRGQETPHGFLASEPAHRVGISVVAGAMLVGGAWWGATHGGLRVSGSTSAARAPSERVQLALIQSGFTMNEYGETKGNPEAMWHLFQRLLTQSRQAVRAARGQFDGADRVVVLWPETVLHEPLLGYPQYAAAMTRMAEEEQAWLVVGLPWLEEDAYSNAAIALSPSDEITDLYAKVRTIPLAEAWARPGTAWRPLQIGGAALGIGLCSELIDPLPARKLVQDGAQLLLFLSSLDHLGRTSALALQAAFAPFRAAETGRWLAQVGSVGVTIVASPAGTIEALLPGFDPGLLIAEVPLESGTTPFLCYANAQAALAAGLVLLSLKRRGAR
jgi:apolipoprotein N-acyltransferase